MFCIIQRSVHAVLIINDTQRTANMTRIIVAVLAGFILGMFTAYLVSPYIIALLK